MMRLFAIDRLDKYARQQVIDGSPTWTLYRAIADEHDARLVGTMLVKLEAESDRKEVVAFVNQKEKADVPYHGERETHDGGGR